jgi:hypothetical protein
MQFTTQQLSRLKQPKPACLAMKPLETFYEVLVLDEKVSFPKKKRKLLNQPLELELILDQKLPKKQWSFQPLTVPEITRNLEDIDSKIISEKYENSSAITLPVVEPASFDAKFIISPKIVKWNQVFVSWNLPKAFQFLGNLSLDSLIMNDTIKINLIRQEKRIQPKELENRFVLSREHTIFNPTRAIDDYLTLHGRQVASKSIASKKTVKINQKEPEIEIQLEKHSTVHHYIISATLFLERNLIKQIESQNVNLYERDFTNQQIIIDSKTIIILFTLNDFKMIGIVEFNEFIELKIPQIVLKTAAHYQNIHLIFNDKTCTQLKLCTYTKPIMDTLMLFIELESILSEQFDASLNYWFTKNDKEIAIVTSKISEFEANSSMWHQRDFLTEYSTKVI